MTHDCDELIEHYGRMVLIRRFEQHLSDLFATGAIAGTSHFCIGQEACAVGATAALDDEDMVASNHRGHGHFLAKGGDPRRMMAELMGKEAGYSGGRGGSQHMANFDIGFLGSNGITAGMIPVATGAALTQKIHRTGRVVLCFFGDGACGQGAFHEAVNMGAIWKLPVIYFLENNLYAMSTAASDMFPIENLADRAHSYGIPGVVVDGNDYFSVREVTFDAVNRARAGEGPSLIEAKTYRQCGHSKSDRCEYRSDDEEQRWLQRDPLVIMRERLLQDGVACAAALDSVEERAQKQIEEASDYAENCPEPDPATADADVFSDPACS
ncbi:MAG: thiamine pyrophosphate-dependent dehydrogenase E1 component subunit alpha [Armatimonadota bacterium]